MKKIVLLITSCLFVAMSHLLAFGGNIIDGETSYQVSPCQIVVLNKKETQTIPLCLNDNKKREILRIDIWNKYALRIKNDDGKIVEIKIKTAGGKAKDVNAALYKEILTIVPCCNSNYKKEEEVHQPEQQNQEKAIEAPTPVIQKIAPTPSPKPTQEKAPETSITAIPRDTPIQSPEPTQEKASETSITVIPRDTSILPPEPTQEMTPVPTRTSQQVTANIKKIEPVAKNNFATSINSETKVIKDANNVIYKIDGCHLLIQKDDVSLENIDLNNLNINEIIEVKVWNKNAIVFRHPKEYTITLQERGSKGNIIREQIMLAIKNALSKVPAAPDQKNQQTYCVQSTPFDDLAKRTADLKKMSMSNENALSPAVNRGNSIAKKTANILVRDSNILRTQILKGMGPSDKKGSLGLNCGGTNPVITTFEKIYDANYIPVNSSKEMKVGDEMPLLGKTLLNMKNAGIIHFKNEVLLYGQKSEIEFCPSSMQEEITDETFQKTKNKK